VTPKPIASSAQVSQRMKEARTSGTAPELLVRRALFSAGLRYRIQYRVSGLSRRTIDVAFPRQHLAIFVDGCFWHGCVLHRTVPKSNRSWWLRKLQENRGRDRDTDIRLAKLCWQVFRFWEHDNPAVILAKIRAALACPGNSSRRESRKAGR
jgi:DNA mismatch endonuclease (patch repair protein)